jgi:hypothetical protein
MEIGMRQNRVPGEDVVINYHYLNAIFPSLRVLIEQQCEMVILPVLRLYDLQDNVAPDQSYQERR